MRAGYCHDHIQKGWSIPFGTQICIYFLGAELPGEAVSTIVSQGQEIAEGKASSDA